MRHRPHGDGAGHRETLPGPRIRDCAALLSVGSMDQNVRDDVFGSTLDQHVRVWNLSWFLSLHLKIRR